MNHLRLKKIKTAALNEAARCIFKGINILLNYFDENLDLIFAYTIYSSKGEIIKDDNVVKLNIDADNSLYYHHLIERKNMVNMERLRFKNLINLDEFMVIYSGVDGDL